MFCARPSRCTFAFILTCLTLLFAVPSQAMVYTPGEFKVDDMGAANYRIPISVPPGTAGMAPNLALSYNSRNGNGLAGMGMAISGLSVIHRCPRTLSQDNINGGINYDANDRFCLDGARLMAISGTYGANATEYRTEIETFNRIISYGGTPATGPEWFQVTTKSGQIMEFGRTPDSRIEAQGKTVVRLWAENRLEDTVGNYLTIAYLEDNLNGQYYPEVIRYTGNSAVGLVPYNSVHFAYQTRPDIAPLYEVGSLIQTTRRLTHIRSYLGVDDTAPLVTEYRLTYQQGATTQRSRLINVTECAADGGCLQPTTLSWTEGGSGEFTKAGSASNLGEGAGTADFNGDGKADLFYSSPLNEGDEYGRDVEIGIALSNGDGSFVRRKPFLIHSYAPSFEGPQYSAPTLGDFNGDGKTDVLAVHNSRWSLFLADGDGNFIIRDAGLGSGGYPTAADFNGDGRADLIISATNNYQRTANDRWNIYLTNTDGSFTYSSSIPTYWTRYSVIPVDFNGDGSTDLLVNPSNSSKHYAVHLSNGDGTFVHNNTFYTEGTASSSDFNGDGKMDIRLPYGSYDRGGWTIHLSKGDGTFIQKQSINHQPRWLGFTPGSDLNGDGTDDFIFIGGSSRVYWSDRNGNFTYRGNVGSGGYGGAIGDFNGDGRADFIDYITGYVGVSGWVGLADIHLSSPVNTPTPDILSTITNGLGGATRLTYKPLTDSSVYTKDTTATYPTQDLQQPLYVVASTSASDGIGGQRGMSYFYQGAKADLTGRGFLGFRARSMTDQQTGIVTTLTFRQDYPYIGLAASMDVKTGTGLAVSHTDNSYLARYLGGTRYFPYISRTVASSHEPSLPGAPLVTRMTVVNDQPGDFDAFGNLLRSTATTVDSTGTYTKSTLNTYLVDTVNWRLDRLASQAITSTVPTPPSGPATQTRSTSYSYYPVSGLLKQEVMEPLDPSLKLTLDFGYDVFGNQTSVALSGLDDTDGNTGTARVTVTRTSTTLYDAQGRFPTSQTNALNQTQTPGFDARFGTMSSLSDFNHVVTTTAYDSFGRKIIEYRPDGTRTSWTYSLCTPFPCSAAPNARYAILMQHAGYASAGAALSFYAPPLTRYFDALDREILTITTGFAGQQIHTATEYDNLGRMRRVSRPFFAGQTAYWTTFTYDTMNRVLTETAPDGGKTTMTYQGLTTVQTNALNQPTTQLKNSAGQLLQVTDAANSITHYRFDPFGNLLQTSDPAHNLTTMSFDIRGRKLSMDDPDLGLWIYRYNAFGEVSYQQDAKGQIVTLVYDKLGRLVQRFEPEGTSVWAYDTATKGIGQLASVNRASDGYRRTYAYDHLGRLAYTATAILGGGAYTESTQYDGFGRISKQYYPTSLATTLNVYNAHGYLSELRNLADNTLLWQANAQDADGQITLETFGNGLTTARSRHPQSGRIQGITTGIGAGSTVQNATYHYDTLGNLKDRSDLTQNLSETFSYDGLNRLSLSTASGLAPRNYYYDTIGNLTVKTGVGGYTYGQNGAGPHAVTQTLGLISGSYSYDANGNRLTGPNASTQSYTSFNNLKQAVQGSSTSSLSYDPERQRTRHISVQAGVTTTTTYTSPRYEEVTRSNRAERKHYLYAGDTLIGLFNHQTTYSGGVGSVSTSLSYFHTDPLGSIVAISSTGGAVTERLSFDPHGKRRNLNGSADTSNSLAAQTSQRGFTGHEQLDGVELIHMNGRVYDPILGRFLSADPNVQFPESTQGFNRYSYVNNNPLSFTDPSGFFLDGFFASFQSFFSSFTTSLNNLVMPTETALATSGTAPANASTTGSMPTGSMQHTGWNQNADTGNASTGANNTLASQDGVVMLPEVTVNADREQSFRSSAGTVADVGIGFTPFGLPADLYTLGTGRTFFGNEPVSPLMSVLGIIPGVSEAAKIGKVAGGLPERLARVVDARFGNSARLGGPSADDVFVTAADDIAGITNSADLARRLTLLDDAGNLRSGPFTVIEFNNPITGLASPVLRANPGFLQGGFTRGGAREFVLPNGRVGDLSGIARRVVE